MEKCRGDRPRLLQNSRFGRLELLYEARRAASEIAPAVRPGLEGMKNERQRRDTKQI